MGAFLTLFGVKKVREQIHVCLYLAVTTYSMVWCGMVWYGMVTAYLHAIAAHRPGVQTTKLSVATLAMRWPQAAYSWQYWSQRLKKLADPYLYMCLSITMPLCNARLELNVTTCHTIPQCCTCTAWQVQSTPYTSRCTIHHSVCACNDHNVCLHCWYSHSSLRCTRKYLEHV